jgi:hypothetical protein
MVIITVQGQKVLRLLTSPILQSELRTPYFFNRDTNLAVDKVKSFEEIYRILKEKGRMVLSDLDTRGWTRIGHNRTVV